MNIGFEIKNTSNCYRTLFGKFPFKENDVPYSGRFVVEQTIEARPQLDQVEFSFINYKILLFERIG